MRYLKRFFESNNFTQELKDFCETYLAYLLDSAEFIINIRPHSFESIIWLQKTESDTNSEKFNVSFDWNEIKEDYIPFIKMLNKSYKLDNTVLKDNKSIFINFELELSFDGKTTLKKGLVGKTDQLQLSVNEIENFNTSKKIKAMGIVIKNERI